MQPSYGLKACPAVQAGPSLIQPRAAALDKQSHQFPAAQLLIPIEVQTLHAPPSLAWLGYELKCQLTEFYLVEDLII
jgi:hypothetical protein